MELVKEIRGPKQKGPLIQIIYSVPKAGKTTIISQLKNHLILELEPGGANYVSGRIQEINRASEFNEILKIIGSSPEKVCDYLVVDTVTKLDEWSEIVGTYNYMGKPQGKTFNRAGGLSTGAKLMPNDPAFETIHALPNGNGYQYSRQQMMDWYDDLMGLIHNGKVKHVILLAHVKDKLVESRNGDTVESIDINLTGKVKGIFASRVDAVGHFYRENGIGYLSYNNEYKVVCGGRCEHLNGKILISEKNEKNEVVTHWDKVFID